MSNLEEDDTSLATSKAASSTSDSSNSEEEMDTDAGLSVSSLQDPDMALHPTHSKSSVDSSLTSRSSTLQRDGDRSECMSGAKGMLNVEENSTRDGARQPKAGPGADETTGTTEQTSKGPVCVLSAGDKAHAYLKKRRDELIC